MKIEKILQDETKFFIGNERYELNSENIAHFCILANKLAKQNNSNAIKMKQAFLLKEESKLLNLSLQDVIEMNSVNFSEIEIKLLYQLNNNIFKFFKEDKLLYDISLYFYQNNIHTIRTILLYISWASKTKALNKMNKEEVRKKILSGKSLQSIILDSSQTFKCNCCGKELPVYEFQVGKYSCYSCEGKKAAYRIDPEQNFTTNKEKDNFDYNKKTKDKLLKKNIEESIRNFKESKKEEIKNSNSYELELILGTINGIKSSIDRVSYEMSNLNEEEKKIATKKLKNIINLIKKERQDNTNE